MQDFFNEEMAPTISKIEVGQMQLITDLMPDGVLLVDEKGQICLANKAACNLFGYKPGELIGRKIEVLVPAKHKKKHVLQRKTYLKNPHVRPMRGMRSYGVTKSGNLIDVGIMLQPIPDNGHVSIICVVRDMKIILHTQEELAESRKDLQKKIAELKMFFYRTSHDLKAPVASILGLINLLIDVGITNDVSITKDVQEYYHLLKGSATNLEKIIKKLSDANRSIGGFVELKKVDLHALIEEVINDVRFSGDYEDIKFKNACSKDIIIRTDVILMRSIVQNLVDNAAKFNRKDVRKAYVHIIAELKNNELQLSVEDNGKGIPENFREDAFGMFTRSEHKESGSGLGLYIVKNAVDILEGTVEFKTSLGSGTKFTIHFPLVLKRH